MRRAPRHAARAPGILAALCVVSVACSDRQAQPSHAASGLRSAPPAGATAPAAPSSSAASAAAGEAIEPERLPAALFSAKDGAHLVYRPTRRPSSTTKATLSVWFKVRADTGDYQHVFSARTETAIQAQQIWIYKGKLSVLSRAQPDNGFWIETKSAEWGAPGKWHHVLAHIDLEKPTAAEAIQLWIDGTQPSVDVQADNPHTQLYALFTPEQSHYVGITGDVEPFDGWLADLHAIDGRLEPVSSFFKGGKAVAFRGDHGANGFAVGFSDTKNLGADAANGNHFENKGAVAAPAK